MRASYVQLLATAGLSASALFIPNLARDEFGATNAEIGVIVAVYSFTVFISSYLFGRASDVHGRKLFLKAGLALSALACLLQIVADDTVSLIVVRAMVGLCAGIYPSALIAHVYETSRRIGNFSSFGSLGFGVGMFIAGLIGAYYEIFLLSTLFMTAAFVITLRMDLGEEKHHKVPLFPLDIMRRNLPVYLSVMLRHTGANMVWVTYPIFLADLGAGGVLIGAVYAVNALTQFTVMRCIDLFDSSKLVIAGFSLSAIVFLAFTLSTDVLQVIVITVALATAWACLYIGSMKYILERTEEMGTGSGLLSSTFSISGILGSLAGGAVSYEFGYHGAMFAAMVMAVAGLGVFLYGNRKRQVLYPA